MPEVSTDHWEAAVEAYQAQLRAYFDERGRGDTVATQRTIQINSTLVPKRGDALVGHLERLTPTTLRDRDVLEVGSGFGALGTYLATTHGPRSLVGIDQQADLIGVATRAVHGAGLDDAIRFAQGDMVDLAPVADGSIDVVLVNNAFLYLTTRDAMTAALGAFRRVLRPGGWLLMYHANRWRWTEPFTGDPIVHLLPAPAARQVCRATGWRHNHGRVKLLSPPATRRLVRRAGFADVTVEPAGTTGRRRGPGRHVSGFFAVAGRRPNG
ncbi:MAG: class I SAM-dependent methyltransferase [Solirubrobacteraceae bacterium]|nr:class I SAM-dependent methyltransferase [Solirubrobacteraceae bacterium]